MSNRNGKMKETVHRRHVFRHWVLPWLLTEFLPLLPACHEVRDFLFKHTPMPLFSAQGHGLKELYIASFETLNLNLSYSTLPVSGMLS